MVWQVDWRSTVVYGDALTALSAVTTLTEGIKHVPLLTWLLPSIDKLTDAALPLSQLQWPLVWSQRALLSRCAVREENITHIHRPERKIVSASATYLYDRLFLCPSLLPQSPFSSSFSSRLLSWPGATLPVSLAESRQVVLYGHLQTILAAAANVAEVAPKAQYTFVESVHTPPMASAETTREQLRRLYPHATFRQADIISAKQEENKIVLQLEHGKNTQEVQADVAFWTLPTTMDFSLLSALHDASIIVDRHLIVDAQFRTNDPNMFFRLFISRNSTLD